MKKCFLHILLVGVLGILAVSCSDEYDSMGLDSRQAQVVFSVAMDTPVSRSRAAEEENKNKWGSQYDPSSPGDAYDNRIDINQFIVKIVDVKRGREYKIKDIIKWKADGAENVYKFVGVVDGIDQSSELTNPKVYVYANMGTTEPAETFSQNATNIPMWGVKSIEGNLTFAPGTRVDLEEISLLRAMAKLEVSLNDEMFKEYALTGATLNKHNSEGYTLPTLPDAFDGSTEDLSLEGVLRPLKKDNSQGTLDLAVAVKDSSYVVYLPEVKNEELKITVQLKQKKVDASGNVTYGSEEEGTFSLSSDVVRNHWYKYNITGFAASQIQVNYEVVDWTNVNIAIGSEGFLYLNRDVIEIYNANADSTQLKFYSSSPIKNITLKDLYKHYRNGDIKETPVDEEHDNVYAYYMNKDGILTQLSAQEGTDEAIVLANISAAVKEESKMNLNGDIIINSPFMADMEASETALQSESHYNTIRYLEFEVENIQGLKATFRVMQYPPVVITNEEGYFSYRDDHNITDEDEVAHFLRHKGDHSLFLSGIQPYHEHDWSNEVNQSAEWHALPVCQRDYGWAGPACPGSYADALGWDEMRYGMGKNPVTFVNHAGTATLSGSYSGGYRTVDGPAPTVYFLRNRYNNLPGATNNDSKGLAIGYPYEVDGKTYRRHYTWDMQAVFWQKAVYEVLREDKTYSIPVIDTPLICETCTRNLSINKNPFRDYILASECKYPSSHKNKHTKTRQFKVGEKTVVVHKGSAAIHPIATNSTSDGWRKYSSAIWTIPVMNPQGTGYNWGSTGDSDPAPSFYNHRMYHIKSTISTGDDIIGVPTIVDGNGNKLNYMDEDDMKIGVTDNSASNANKISPFLAVASELGETYYADVVRRAAVYGYPVPDVKKLYALAVRHCREYVETTYIDKNNNYRRDDNEDVVHYHDWRLPTKAEIEMIISYQENSRAMDKLMTGQYYFCVTGNGDSDDVSNIYNWVSSQVPNFKESKTGYYIRCVRDVKPEGKNGNIEKE